MMYAPPWLLVQPHWFGFVPDSKLSTTSAAIDAAGRSARARTNGRVFMETSEAPGGYRKRPPTPTQSLSTSLPLPFPAVNRRATRASTRDRGDVAGSRRIADVARN